MMMMMTTENEGGGIVFDDYRFLTMKIGFIF